MDGTLTRIIGKRKVMVFEDTKLEGQKYGILRHNGGIPELLVSPSVYKLMRDDFDTIADGLQVFEENSDRGKSDAEGILSELSTANHRSKALPKMRRLFRNRVHRKPKKNARNKTRPPHRARRIPPPSHDPS